VTWIPLVAWAGALVLALVILGYCAYEVVWKANRLRADLARLQALQEQVEQLRRDAYAASARAAALGVR
jgi:outer membrane murein-binding lipoprotein Lpp